MLPSFDMRILITGATGLIGKKLALALLRRDHQISVITRSTRNLDEKLPFPCKAFNWEQLNEALDSVDAVIHLAGEPVAGRWSSDKKKRIYESRVHRTRELAAAIGKTQKPPKVFISGSAIGIYGPAGDRELSEDSTPYTEDDFLADVCKDWEKFDLPSTVRTSILRIGLVLSRNEGMMKNLEDLFRTGFAGNLGNGKQWMSWIHIDDLISMFLNLLEEGEGVYNGVAPEPVTNAEFTRQLARILKRPAILPAPKFGVALAMGEFAENIFSSQKVQSRSKIPFQFTNLSAALEDLFSPKAERLFEEMQWLPFSPEKVFDFFSNENNLEKITPPFLNFRVQGKSTPTIEEGTTIDYKLKIHGFPAKWRSLISDWQPGERFVDSQLSGPYQTWHHTHEFEPLAGGTLILDKVRYRLPLGWLGDLIAHPLVKKDIQSIFSYRQKVIRELFSNTKSETNSGTTSSPN